MENNNYFEVDIKPREEGESNAVKTGHSLQMLFPECYVYDISFRITVRRFNENVIPTIRIQFDEKDFKSFMYAFYMFVHGIDYYHQKTPYFTFEEFCEDKNVTLPDYDGE